MELNDIIKPENLVYEKPRLMNENPMHYCPGCSHGVIHKLIAVIVFVNNAIYGMTGGQMAPTTLEGMPTATCPYGRNIALNGYPLKIGDLLAQLEGTCLVTRQSVQTAAAVRKAKKMLRKAFENAMAGKGTSVVEFVSTCSSGWKMTPEKANKWMEANMFPFYPLGDLKNVE